MYNAGSIESFKELMDQIAYDWDSIYTLSKTSGKNGKLGFVVNKLFIGQDFVEYKTDRWKLAPGIFEKVEILYNLLQE